MHSSHINICINIKSWRNKSRLFVFIFNSVSFLFPFCLRHSTWKFFLTIWSLLLYMTEFVTVTYFVRKQGFLPFFGMLLQTVPIACWNFKKWGFRGCDSELSLRAQPFVWIPRRLWVGTKQGICFKKGNHRMEHLLVASLVFWHELARGGCCS